jgi:hypothetical protein
VKRQTEECPFGPDANEREHLTVDARPLSAGLADMLARSSRHRWIAGAMLEAAM